MNEVWIDIEGYEGIYRVSNMGNIRSLDRITNHGAKRKGIILKKKTNTNGYHTVSLYKNGKREDRLIHRLVAEHFIENKNNKEEVNHIDGCKKNNVKTNLEWNTSKENIHHAVSMGMIKHGEEHHFAKLSDDDVEYIRTHYIPRSKEFSQTALAKRFNVSQSHLSAIIKRKDRIK